MSGNCANKPSYAPEDAEKLENEQLRIAGRAADLITRFLNRHYKSQLGWEHATQGFGRRVKTLARCIANVYAITPPTRTEIPTTDELTDLGISLQAFVFNVFGAIDNLAWIWVSERGVAQSDGSPLRPQFVGLRSANLLVRRTLSPEFQAYLANTDGWFEYQEGFRHALGHRVPLYVPPYVLPGEQSQKKYQQLDILKDEAVRRHDLYEVDRLDAQQNALGIFRPFMNYVAADDPKTVPYHSQVLCDFYTVEEMGEMMLKELDRP